jgi:hypothetical protein
VEAALIIERLQPLSLAEAFTLLAHRDVGIDAFFDGVRAEPAATMNQDPLPVYMTMHTNMRRCVVYWY